MIVDGKQKWTFCFRYVFLQKFRSMASTIQFFSLFTIFLGNKKAFFFSFRLLNLSLLFFFSCFHSKLYRRCTIGEKFRWNKTKFTNGRNSHRETSISNRRNFTWQTKLSDGRNYVGQTWISHRRHYDWKTKLSDRRNYVGKTELSDRRCSSRSTKFSWSPRWKLNVTKTNKNFLKTSTQRCFFFIETNISNKITEQIPMKTNVSKIRLVQILRCIFHKRVNL